MSAPTYSNLGALLGRAISPEQGEVVLQVVSAMAKAHTRGGIGWTGDVPNAEIAAVILTASARLIVNATGLLFDETEGPSSISYRSAFTGWTLVERMTLDRYRVKAL
jgi:hypothetical protein